MNKELLESVDGISRFHEQMYIERDEAGSIKQVYDYEYNPIDSKLLIASWFSIVSEKGFQYKNDFIEFPGAIEAYKRKALLHQRTWSLKDHDL